MELKLQFKGTLPPRIALAVDAVRKEDDALAADELVWLGEEILLHLAALGLAAYLSQNKQEEAHNDFVVNLFLAEAHSYNAGPIWRTVAHMVKSAEGDCTRILTPFFWQNGELDPDVNHAAELRNQVMHGFFVLPPETNLQEGKNMAAILDRMGEAGLFSLWIDEYHFLRRELGVVGFSGRWRVFADVGEWKTLEKCDLFGAKARRVRLENEGAFLEKESEALCGVIPCPEAVRRLSGRTREAGEAILLSHRPDRDGLDLHAAGVGELLKQGFEVVHFRIDPKGAAFTRDFVEQTFRSRATELKIRSKKGLKWYSKARESGEIAKPWALAIHGIHWATGHPRHLLSTIQTILEAGILCLGTGWPLEEVAGRMHTVEHFGVPMMPDANMVEVMLANRVRFREPSMVLGEQKLYFVELHAVVNDLLLSMKEEGEVVARRFADRHGHHIHLVHEAMMVLSASMHLERRSFHQCEMAEEYPFPSEMNESTRLYLTLGRHDLHLGYRHRVLTLNPPK